MIPARPPVAITTGLVPVGPLGEDPPHHAVGGVGGPEQHARLDALLGPPADDPLGRGELGGRQLGGEPRQLVGRGAEPRHDGAADEAPVAGDAVEGRGGAEVHHDGVGPVELERGQAR